MAKSKRINKILFFIILAVSGILRFVALDKYPGGVHVDEAFAGYEAYSLMTKGVDSWGYHYPIYFISWGSGMNVLESYLMIPFVKIFGLCELAIRLPQAILSVISLIAFYFILKKIKDERFALIGLLLMGICPWHFLLSRWGLESNLCLSMILLGTLFYVYGTEFFVKENISCKKTAYLILSAFFFGLDLYCYAATWIHIAVILCIWTSYIFIYARKRNGVRKSNDLDGSQIVNEEKESVSVNKIVCRNVIIAILLLFIMALPLLLFVLVNIGIIQEIKGFISIPKMLVFRNDEVFNLSSLYSRVHDLAYILVCQNDKQMWNGYLPYGMFYMYSLPVIFVGVWRVFVKLINDIKQKQFSYSLMLVSYTTLATILVLLQGVSTIRSNYLQLSLLFYWAAGVEYLFDILKGYIGKVLVLSYVVSFVFFLFSYTDSFYHKLAIRQDEGLGEAIEAALPLLGDKYNGICLDYEMKHPRVLFYTKMNQEEYMSSVKWKNYPDKYLEPESLGPFVWDKYEETGFNDNYIYIIEYDKRELFEANGYEVSPYGHVWLAVK